jgi:streptomycin 6-kinase
MGGPSVDAGARVRMVARFGSAAEAWCDALPAVLEDLARRWRVELGAPIPRGSMSVVFHCRTADGRAAVLKASPDRARIGYEAAALQGWHTSHTPAVYAFDERLGALLIEAIEPGTPLVVSSAYPALARVAELVGSLHADGVPDPSYPTVGYRVDHLFDSSETLYARYPETAALVRPELHDRGRRLATTLAADAAPSVLLHGDLTPSNILDGGARRGLVAIDPAACLGDPAFDAVDMVLWQAEDLRVIEARARRLAATSGLDAERVLGWCTAFAAMNALEIAARAGSRHPHVETLLALAEQAPT